MTSNSELFDEIIDYPNAEFGKRFDALVGLDEIKSRLVQEALVLLSSAPLDEWCRKHHKNMIDVVKAMEERVPLIVLAGDVGTGKTEMAESVGHPIAAALGNSQVKLFPLNLAARGQGLVGQMTTLITQAFEYVRSMTPTMDATKEKLGRASILLIDEADALAQSRELAQMHHEDRAGVNALIRGIDGFRRDGLPILTIMCTNRSEALDPAIKRRAARIFVFERPTLERRQNVLVKYLAGSGLGDEDILEASKLLGGNDLRPWGATYSDLRQRFIPDLVLEAFAKDVPISRSILLEIASEFIPTKPFEEEFPHGS